MKVVISKNTYINLSKNYEKEFYNYRKLVEKLQKLKNPTNRLIKNLINRIVVYDKGNDKEVQVYFNFKELTFIANGLKA